MPRPGPRPYDCVRRAWHSERHHPIRGTLIQEIFRVVDEIHGSATKKNKEYQEKLPVVVLKAEEIIYSKANSEAEYMDLSTLLDRTNEAIDVIIRRDENTETGDYLHPCIEAALNLGCSLSKTSRSQRNSPRCYLNRSNEEVQNKKQRLEHQIQQPSNMLSVFPLYYGNKIPFEDNNTSGPAIVGGAQDLLSRYLNPSSSSHGSHSQSFIIVDDPQNSCTKECDLSLRLGPLTIPAPSFENGQVQDTEVRSKDQSMGVQVWNQECKETEVSRLKLY
ncbi:hypothetical protein SESBI_21479 [Sesbania bispinosa]|nr:hypothetical protein SESBI_21479 [Sesbania bispinosa]